MEWRRFDVDTTLFWRYAISEMSYLAEEEESGFFSCVVAVSVQCPFLTVQ